MANQELDPITLQVISGALDTIAEELGISVTAAKVRLHRARRRLREKVLPLPGEERGRDG